MPEAGIATDQVVTRTRKPWLPLVATVAMVVARWAEPHLPGAQDYISSKGIVPSWETWVAAAVGIVAALALLATSGRRLVSSFGWLAVVLLLWAAVGIVFDAFRAFFWVTGIPAGDFALVDWPGFLTRTVAFVATISLARATLSYQRASRGSCMRCGRIDGVQAANKPWLGYLACVLSVVYPGVKYYWWLGGSFGRPPVYTEGFPVLETALLIGGAVLSLALVRPWGRIWPRWVLGLAGRRVPRGLPIAAGWGLSAALLLQGLIPVFATINHLFGGPALPFDTNSPNSWLILVVYGSWALFGAALLGATITYQGVTKPRCPRCQP
jgi:hypothetical protein